MVDLQRAIPVNAVVAALASTGDLGKSFLSKKTLRQSFKARGRAYFSPSWTASQADRGRRVSVIVDDGGGAQVIF